MMRKIEVWHPVTSVAHDLTYRWGYVDESPVGSRRSLFVDVIRAEQAQESGDLVEVDVEPWMVEYVDRMVCEARA